MGIMGADDEDGRVDEYIMSHLDAKFKVPTAESSVVDFREV